MADGALDDLRVLDLSQGLAASYCTKWFADFGADVVKIEPPGPGDPVRGLGPFKDDVPNPDTGASFLYLNGGKKSVSLSLESDTGRDILRRLAARFDVVVEDFVPGTLPGIGLGEADLRAPNPKLIYLSLTNFGQTGPYRDYPVTELTLGAISGTLGDRVIKDRRPLKMGGYQGMYIGGRVAFISAIAAIYNRDKTGEGQYIDLSLMEAAAGNDLASPTTYSYTGVVHQVRRPPSARGRGGQGRYEAADGFVDVMPGVGGLKKLAAMLGDPELAQHELFKNHTLRAQRAEEFDKQFMEPYFQGKTRAEIVESAQEHGMPFSYTLRPAELLEEPHLKARNYFVETDHPVAGKVTAPGAPMRLSETPWRTGPAPQQGESNQAVLGDDLGLSSTELTRLREQRVI
ncbi:MAG TPA: CoA transferase [Dehalococcoidia bacterium]|nr:CoA transferase [Dehalococcoidia bacterium]